MTERTTPRGFAALSPERMREIARIGGRTAHAEGWAHQFTRKEASAAGKMGAAVRSAPWWTCGSGRIELRIIMRDALNVAVGGCDNGDDCDRLAAQPYVARQLRRVDPGDLRETLREYGAWDETELGNHTANLRRMLWLACWDLREQEA